MSKQQARQFGYSQGGFFLVLLGLSACGGGAGGTSGANVPLNTAPKVFLPNEERVAFTGHSFHLDINAGGIRFRDAEGDELAFQVLSLPAELTLLGSTISGTPSQVGTYHLTIIAEDPHGLTGTAHLSLIVKDNSPPRVAQPNLNRTVAVNQAIDYDCSRWKHLRGRG